jgi:hypothetical protein
MVFDIIAPAFRPGFNNSTPPAPLSRERGLRERVYSAQPRAKARGYYEFIFTVTNIFKNEN